MLPYAYYKFIGGCIMYQHASQIDLKENCVKGFSPTEHGFKCPNEFEDSPFRVARIEVGNSKNGMCGALVLASKNYFKGKIKIPSDTKAPDSKNNPELFEYLKECQWATMTAKALFAYSYRTFGDDTKTDKKYVCEAWLEIKSMIDKNELALVGMIRSKTTLPYLAKNIFNRSNREKPFTNHHQVLVFAYKQDNAEIILSIYDPAHPNENDIKLVFNIDGSNIKHIKEIRGDAPQDLGRVYSIFVVDCTFDKKPPIPVAENTNIPLKAPSPH